MTIEQELLNNTPLPLDIIRYCIEPFLIPDQAHWRRKFDLVLNNILAVKDGIQGIYSGGQARRTDPLMIAYARMIGQPIITFFRFVDGHPFLCVTGLIRFLDKKPVVQPSLISRIKSWFKRQK